MRGWVLTAALLAGCVADTPAKDAGDPPLDSDARGVDSPGAETDGADETDAPEVFDDSGRSSLQRLTASQLQRVILDLFPSVALTQVTADLPLPEDATEGFHNNGDLRESTPLLVDRLALLVEQVATRVGKASADLTGCPTSDPDPCTRAWLVDVAQRAWRRPLDQDEQDALEAQYDAGTTSDIKVRRALEYILLSPYLVYQVREGRVQDAADGAVPLTDHELASRLSLLLWETLPDETLVREATAGALRTPDQVRAQVTRMLADARAGRMVRSFVREWLHLDRALTLRLDDKLYLPQAEGDTIAVTALKTSLVRDALAETLWLAEDTILHGEATLAALLTRPAARVGRVSAFYVHGMGGAPDPEILTCELSGRCEAPPLQPDELAASLLLEGTELAVPLRTATLPAHRIGLFTSAGFLLAHAGPRHPSAVRRGVTVLDRLLCAPPDPPPPGVAGLSEAGGGEAHTNRDRLEAHVRNPACAQCHEAIDGAGFPFEVYDSVGAWRTLDAGYPVDPTGELMGSDVDGPVADHVALAQRLAGSRQAHDCFASTLWRYTVGRAPTVGDAPEVEALQERFSEVHHGDVRALLTDILTSTTFRSRSTGGEP